MEDIYLLNRIKNLVNNIDEETNYDYTFRYIGAREKEANIRLINKIADIKNGNVRPNQLLSSPLLNSGSILNKITYSFDNLDTEHLQQYEYTRILRDLPYLDLILDLYGFRPDSSYYRNITQELRIYLRRYLMNKVWSSVADKYVRVTIEDKLNSLYEKVQK